MFLTLLTSLVLSLVFSSVTNVSPRVVARSLPEGDSFTLKDVKIVADGKTSENGGSLGGRIIWVALTEQGRFVFSLEPHDGYDFRKVAKLQYDAISFSHDGKDYQLISNAPILSGGGDAEVWLWYDAEYKGCYACVGSASDFSALRERRDQ